MKNLFNKLREKIDPYANIIIIFLMVFTIIIALLPYAGITPSNKSTNQIDIILKFLSYRIPIISVIILLILFSLLNRKKIKFINEKTVTDKISPNEIDIDIRSRGEQIVFYIPHEGTPSLKVWLKIINLSSLEFRLDRIKWGLHMGLFDRNGEDAISETFRPKEIKDNILIAADLSDANIKSIRNTDESNPGATYFQGTLFFSCGGNSDKKEFNLNEVKFEIKGKIKEEVELTEEERWILSTLLNKTNQDEYKKVLQEEYSAYFNKNVASFNILRKELVIDKKLIIELKSYNGDIWKLTNEGVGIIAKK